MSEASVRFIGQIVGIRPTSGLFENPITEVGAYDWMSFLSMQEAGLLTLTENLRVDQALDILMPRFIVQPESEDFDIGEEIFDLVFVGDRPKTSMAMLFQKLAQNDMGRIYQKGDGTIKFEHRHTRPENLTSFTLDGIMTKFKIAYEQADIFNFITTRVSPTDIDADATTLIWDLRGAPEIKPGETLTFRCPYTDPNTGARITAIEVVDPPVTEFGSIQDFTSTDMDAYLTVVMDIGANMTEVHLTNTHPTQTGYLNDLQIRGKGIYTYDRILYDAVNMSSIVTRGARKKFVRLDLLTDPTKGKNYAHFILSKVKGPHLKSTLISFLANQTSGLASSVISLEPSDRFTALETVTGVQKDFFINRLRYRLVDGMVWVDILPAPETYGTFIWDTSHWNSEDDAHWSL